MLIIEVNYEIFLYSEPICVVCSLDYDNIGCYKDTSNRAIQTLERTDVILDGRYTSRKNAIAKCAVAAARAGYSMFAVQNGGWCAASATAHSTFAKYGQSASCKADGEGGGWANQVYRIKGRQWRSQDFSEGEAIVTTQL